jgi:hypothetical protein
VTIKIIHQALRFSAIYNYKEHSALSESKKYFLAIVPHCSQEIKVMQIEEKKRG